MLRTLGHILLASIFIGGGSDAFKQPERRAPRAAQAGIPEPEAVVQLNGAMMVIGGTLLALNVAPKLAALLLLGTIVPTTIVGHPFWKEQSEQARKAQQTQFLKNLGLIGGLILVLLEKD